MNRDPPLLALLRVRPFFVSYEKNAALIFANTMRVVRTEIHGAEEITHWVDHEEDYTRLLLWCVSAHYDAICPLMHKTCTQSHLGFHPVCVHVLQPWLFILRSCSMNTSDGPMECIRSWSYWGKISCFSKHSFQRVCLQAHCIKDHWFNFWFKQPWTRVGPWLVSPRAPYCPVEAPGLKAQGPWSTQGDTNQYPDQVLGCLSNSLVWFWFVELSNQGLPSLKTLVLAIKNHTDVWEFQFETWMKTRIRTCIFRSLKQKWDVQCKFAIPRPLTIDLQVSGAQTNKAIGCVLFSLFPVVLWHSWG